MRSVFITAQTMKSNQKNHQIKPENQMIIPTKVVIKLLILNGYQEELNQN